MERGVYLVIATAVISGVSIFLNKFGVAGIDAGVFTFGKNLVVAVLLFSTIFLFKHFKELVSLKRRDWLRLAAIGLIGGSVPFLLFFSGLQMTSAANGSFIHKTMFVFVAALSAFFLKERLTRKALVPAILLLTGNALLLNMPFGFGTGEFLILIATLFWAVEIVISKNALRTLSPLSVTFGRMFFGAIFILPFLAVTGSISEIGSLVEHAPWVFLTSALLFFYVLTFYSGLKTVKAHVATSILLLGSPITTLLSAVFLGAAVPLNNMLSTLLIVSGVALMMFFSRQVSLAPSRLGVRNGWI